MPEISPVKVVSREDSAEQWETLFEAIKTKMVDLANKTEAGWTTAELSKLYNEIVYALPVLREASDKSVPKKKLFRRRERHSKKSLEIFHKYWQLYRWAEEIGDNLKMRALLKASATTHRQYREPA